MLQPMYTKSYTRQNKGGSKFEMGRRQEVSEVGLYFHQTEWARPHCGIAQLRSAEECLAKYMGFIYCTETIGDYNGRTMAIYI